MWLPDIFPKLIMFDFSLVYDGHGHASFLKEIAGLVQKSKNQKRVGVFDNLVVFVF